MAILVFFTVFRTLALIPFSLVLAVLACFFLHRSLPLRFTTIIVCIAAFCYKKQQMTIAKYTATMSP